MKETRLIMGMPIALHIVGDAPAGLLDHVFDYFVAVDKRFSLYKANSEISAYNRGEINEDGLSTEMLEVLALCARTQNESDDYFQALRPDGLVDPSGIVKGWAIRNAAEMIRKAGVENFSIDAGGDIQTGGKNFDRGEWTIGIRNPFKEAEIIKALTPKGRGIATSGSYIRGAHIYNPLHPERPVTDIVSLTVIGPDVLEADRFATAAFAMGFQGIYFLEEMPGFEAYVISADGVGTQTSGFGAYEIS